MKNIWLLVSIAAGAFTTSQPLLAEKPIVWVTSSTLVRVSPTEKPPSKTTTTALIYAARGEVQSFQVVIQAPVGGLTNVRFSVSDLVWNQDGADR